MGDLVLSCFPGFGLLDHAFSEEGFTVVRGPDVIWGGDIRTFHPPPGVFDGVIGGPPCPHHSTMHGLVQLERNSGERPEDLIPEFVRCVSEARPAWWLCENARQSYVPDVAGYETWSEILCNRHFGETQSRQRRITFGTPEGTRLPVGSEMAALENPVWEYCVLGGHGGARGTTRRGMKSRDLPEMLRLQGFPPDWLDHQPWTMQAKRKMVGNGVALPMGRALARAVRQAKKARVAVE